VPPVVKTTWTTRALLEWMGSTFKGKGLDAPKLCAEMLLSHVLKCDRLRLYMDADRPASDEERAVLRALVTRALANEPVQYLVGEAWFFSMAFKVDRRVLIPRPCTEMIVEQVVQHARVTPGHDAAAIADVCTGSGCVALSLAKHLKQSRVLATDVSEDALAVARENATRHGVTDRVEFVRGDLLSPLLEHPMGSRLNYLVSNPPYIPDHEWNDDKMMGANVKGHEPEIALRGGVDGLKFVRPIVEDGPARLLPGGVLLVEIASSTAEDVLGLARGNALLEGARIVADLEGLPRMLMARRV
jgi:release factor glutamine methyltransferase